MKQVKALSMSWRAIAVLGALTMLTSCQSPLPTVPGLVGHWSDQEGTGGLDLNSDGTCVVTGISRNVLLREQDPGGEIFSGPCTWFLGDGTGDLRADDGFPLVTFKFDSSAPVAGVTMSVQGEGTAAKLFWDLGDPDDLDRYILTRS